MDPTPEGKKAVSGNICTQTLKVAAQRSQAPSEEEPGHLALSESLIAEVLGVIHPQREPNLGRQCRVLEAIIHEVVFYRSE